MAECTERTPRVVAARKLHRRAARERVGRFLAEGAQAVGAALAAAPGSVRVYEVFVTPAAADRNPGPLAAAHAAGVTVSMITERAAAALSETVTPQGLVAVCGLLDVPMAEALDGDPRLVVVLVGASDPGNAGTVIRVADAAGADAVLLAGDAVDPHNGKCVRASAGSVFHLPVARERDVATALAACREAGLRLFAATAIGERDLHDPATSAALAGPAAWLFGNEAHGLPAEVAAAADERVRVPIYGRAESLNLATASAVCIYATALVQRGATISPDAAR
ncbi:TrmH family RNA methyltransferase [Pseudonocardia acaciae]|uniref:TrmH family RNA methyltransferase n=1 Tax=Pseudonocardia acaciae TaxID=551276 RepID=UPI00048F8E1D|nr:RNA methyltransferase [Pseudonocardia acaciae]